MMPDDRSKRCPVCLKQFGDRRAMLNHMKSLRHSIDGDKRFVRNSDETRMADYHRDKTGQQVILYRYGEQKK